MNNKDKNVNFSESILSYLENESDNKNLKKIRSTVERNKQKANQLGFSLKEQSNDDDPLQYGLEDDEGEDSVLSESLILHLESEYTNDIINEMSAIGVKKTKEKNNESANHLKDSLLEKTPSETKNNVLSKTLIMRLENENYTNDILNEISAIGVRKTQEKNQQQANALGASLKNHSDAKIEKPQMRKDVEDVLKSLENLEIEEEDLESSFFHRITHNKEDTQVSESSFPQKKIAPAEHTNSKISKYILGNCLADEGQAQIYEVQNYPDKVCKIFKDNTMRAQREIDVLLHLKELKHPGIVEIQEVCSFNQRQCFFMRKIQGQTLSQMKIKKDLLPCLLLMWRIADAVSIVHAKGVSHRDLKPGNIMLDNYLFPTIIDFGLTKHDNGGSATGGVFGTPRYMAPEQFLGKHCLGEQLDVHALGIIFYEILSEEWPFGVMEEYTMTSVIRPIVEEMPKDIPALFRIPTRLKNICLRCLEKDTEKRYINATSLASELWQELCRLLYAEIKILEDKETYLKIAERIFDPHWLGRNKSLKFWKKLFADFFQCEINIISLPEEYKEINVIRQKVNPYKMLKKEINNYSQQLVKILHISEGHQALFQQKPKNSLMKVLKEDHLLNQDGSVCLARDEFLAIEKAFIKTYKIAKSLGMFISLSFDSIEYDEDILFSLSSIEPSEEESNNFILKLFANDAYKETWQQKIQETKKKFLGFIRIKNYKSPWEIIGEVLASEISSKVIPKREDNKPMQQNPGFITLQKETYACDNKKFAIQKYLHEQTKLQFVAIPQGIFSMGSTKNTFEQPIHQVKVDSFLLSQTTVTQKIWFEIMGTQPWKGQKHTTEGDDYPATYIHFEEAKDFCLKTNLQLPSEAQWEYACRGTSIFAYYWGSNFEEAKDYVWYAANTRERKQDYPHPVAKKLPNAFGLYDMLGNVWEWCLDEWHNDYKNAPLDGTAWETTKNKNVYRVRRGAAFWYTDLHCHCSFREKIAPNIRHGGLGFRVCYKP